METNVTERFANRSSTMPGQLFESAVDTLITVIYVILSVVTVASNFFVCFVFYKGKPMRRPFTIVLANLSFADMMSGFAIQPYIWIDFTQIKSGGYMGRLLCSVSVGLLCFMYCVATVTLSLCAVTMLRYLSIVRNYRGFAVTSNNLAVGFSIATWLAGTGLTIPSGMSFENDPNRSICHRSWPKGVNGGLFSLITIFVYLILPIILMITCYSLLGVHIWKMSLQSAGSNIAARRSRKSVTVLVGLLIFTLVICWTPFAVVWIVGRQFNYFSDGAKGEYERQRWLRVAMLFALLNSALDPFIYVYYSSDYRKGTKSLLQSLRKNRAGHSVADTSMHNSQEKYCTYAASRQCGNERVTRIELAQETRSMQSKN